VEHRAGSHYLDLLNHQKIPYKVINGKANLSLNLKPKEITAIAQFPKLLRLISPAILEPDKTMKVELSRPLKGAKVRAFLERKDDSFIAALAIKEREVTFKPSQIFGKKGGGLSVQLFEIEDGQEFIRDEIVLGEIKGEIKLVVSDVPDCFALKRAEKSGIKRVAVERKDFKSKEEFEKEILKNLKKENIDLIVLAGYMKLLSGDFIKEYKNKILNIHPALLPSFKGAHGIKDAFSCGVKVTGVSVHFVTEDMDAGPMILQVPIIIKEDDTESSLTEHIHKEEHKIYPKAIQLFIEGRLKLEGRRVKIL